MSASDEMLVGRPLDANDPENSKIAVSSSKAGAR